MGAKKLKRQKFDHLAYLEERLGPVSVPIELWLPQVEKNAKLGLVEPQLLLHLFTNLDWFHKSKHFPLYSFTKRAFDLVVSSLAMPFVACMYAIIALAIKLDSPGPVFFMQPRIGFLGKPFLIWKFRTMHENSAAMLSSVQSDSVGGFFKLNHDPRITRVGRILRRWSLDETPQLINVLVGDMSLVGPRPLPVYDVACIPYKLLDRYAVPPGLTGLWQVLARDSNDGRRNLVIDKTYVKTRGWKLDLWILWKTPLVVIRGKGAR